MATFKIYDGTKWVTYKFDAETLGGYSPSNSDNWGKANENEIPTKGSITGYVGQHYVLKTSLNNYLPLTGGTLTGNLTVNGDSIFEIETENNNIGFNVKRSDTPVFTISQTGAIARIMIDGTVTTDGNGENPVNDGNFDGDVSLFFAGECGTDGQVLTSHGPALTPSWTTIDQNFVKDVTVNGTSVLNDTTKVAAITIKPLECGYKYVPTNDSAWTTYTLNGTVYQAIRITKTNAVLGVFNSSNQRITVQEAYDDNYLYLCVGKSKINCTIRTLNGNSINNNGNNDVLIEVSSITMKETLTSTPLEPVYDYNINVKVLSGTLQPGDRIQICKSIKKGKYNIDKTTKKHINERAVQKIVPFNYKELTTADITNNLLNVYTFEVKSTTDLFRSYTFNGNLRVPLTVRVSRPKQISNNKELSYIPISNSVKLGSNRTTNVIKLL